MLVDDGQCMVETWLTVIDLCAFYCFLMVDRCSFGLPNGNYVVTTIRDILCYSSTHYQLPRFWEALVPIGLLNPLGHHAVSLSSPIDLYQDQSFLIYIWWCIQLEISFRLRSDSPDIPGPLL